MHSGLLAERVDARIQAVPEVMIFRLAAHSSKEAGAGSRPLTRKALVSVFFFRRGYEGFRAEVAAMAGAAGDGRA